MERKEEKRDKEIETEIWRKADGKEMERERERLILRLTERLIEREEHCLPSSRRNVRVSMSAGSECQDVSSVVIDPSLGGWLS